MVPNHTVKYQNTRPAEPFSTFSAVAPVTTDTNVHVNLFYDPTYSPPADGSWNRWGRCIFFVEDIDAFYADAVGAGLSPAAPPADAVWGERYFHILDNNGHELGFATPLYNHPRWKTNSAL